MDHRRAARADRFPRRSREPNLSSELAVLFLKYETTPAVKYTSGHALNPLAGNRDQLHCPLVVGCIKTKVRLAHLLKNHPVLMSERDAQCEIVCAHFQAFWIWDFFPGLDPV